VIRTLLISFILLNSSVVMPTGIENFIFYQSNFDQSTKEESFAAYMTKNSPCFYIKIFATKEEIKYCKIEGIDLDLEKDFPSIYIGEQSVEGSSAYFTVAAPWNEQRCRVYIPKKKLTCKPTGRN